MAPKELGTALAVPFTFRAPILRDTRFCGILKIDMGLPNSQSGCAASCILAGHTDGASTRYYLYYRRFWRF